MSILDSWSNFFSVSSLYIPSFNKVNQNVPQNVLCLRLEPTLFLAKSLTSKLGSWRLKTFIAVFILQGGSNEAIAVTVHGGSCMIQGFLALPTSFALFRSFVYLFLLWTCISKSPFNPSQTVTCDSIQFIKTSV